VGSVAFIGTRNLDAIDAYPRALFERAVKAAVDAGCSIRTGACSGADQLAAETALSRGGVVHLVLPWLSYERAWYDRMAQLHSTLISASVYREDQHQDWLESVYTYHPAGRFLSQGATRLHARNYGIVARSQCVVALPPAPRSGGTGQGLRVAYGLGIRAYDLAVPDDCTRLQERLLARA
jgi:hypothetical protein